MIHSERPPIAWTIAGSDSSGGAGIQADLKSFHDFGVHGCSVITALTAQNSTAVGHIEVTSHKSLAAQINALDSDLPAKAIKLGMLADTTLATSITKYLDDYSGIVVCDPVLKASSGDPLAAAAVTDLLRQEILPRTSLITPNKNEAEALLNRAINSQPEIEQAARDLLALGCQAVLITGGHFDAINGRRLDYFTNGERSFWLSGPSIDTIHSHGSGCTLSSAITACLAKGYDMVDALVLAKAYTTQGFRNAVQIGGGPGAVAHGKAFPVLENFPTIHSQADHQALKFSSCQALGLYPIVDSAEWIERLLPLGIKTIQLRIKDQPVEKLREQIKRAVALSEQYQAQLFINDYWQLATECGAYGVHLDQENLDQADLSAIAAAGLRLGISAHSNAEIARAHGIKPSYIAIGPVYETTTKAMKFLPQGLNSLQQWVELLQPAYPLTAIGGISLERTADVLGTGVASCAMVSAITQAENVEATVAALLALHTR